MTGHNVSKATRAKIAETKTGQQPSNKSIVIRIEMSNIANVSNIIKSSEYRFKMREYDSFLLIKGPQNILSDIVQKQIASIPAQELTEYKLFKLLTAKNGAEIAARMIEINP